ncbi:serine/threonine protein kinase [Catenulispora sp. GP43]|uniref:serine/threonine-protein kinase n=1 Tax=Catenulispora sp. GP43 TaxID=3156263 RepID=UPI0035141CC3
MAVPSNVPSTVASRGLTLAGGRYRLVRQLGNGGFGRVWLARDETLRVDVAIKEVLVVAGATPRETSERIERAAWEARNAAQLRDHPNIVTVYDVIVESGTPWMIMQYIAGRSLAEAVAQDGPLSVARAEQVAAALLSALGACHTAGIMHRDVKPENTLLAEDGTVLLADFGIAKHTGQSPMTAQDLVIGSLPYIAPERARGNPAEPASDLFSLGVTLHFAVEGTSPFDRGSGMASLAAVLMDELPEPARAGKLAGLIKALTAKDPSARPTAAQALAMIGSGSVPQQSGPKKQGSKKPGSKKLAEPKPKPKPTKKVTAAQPAATQPSPAVVTPGPGSGPVTTTVGPRSLPWTGHLVPGLSALAALIGLAVVLFGTDAFAVDYFRPGPDGSDGSVGSVGGTMNATMVRSATAGQPAILSAIMLAMMFATPVALALLTFAGILSSKFEGRIRVTLGLSVVAVLAVVGTATEFKSDSLKDWNDLLKTASGPGYATGVHPLAGFWIWVGAIAIAVFGAWKGMSWVPAHSRLSRAGTP